MKLILVGGFLGAGKTTLLGQAAEQLTRQGHCVGLITNDQVPDLVDTAILTNSGSHVREVAGSCFCCNFDGFRNAVQSLVDSGSDCILAEPVGSCTDLSATIIQPLKALYPEYSVAPLSVLIDPSRAREVLREKNALLHADAAYILHLQLEEADQIVLSKIDTLSSAERDQILSYLRAEFPHAQIRTMSASHGEGVDAWLESVFSDARAGNRIITVDYDRYANGEAVLGWLNAVVGLRWIGNLQSAWHDYVSDLLGRLQHELRVKQCEVGHIKMLLETNQGRIIANLTGLNGIATTRTEGSNERLTATLTINARVQVSPEGIDDTVRRCLAAASHARVAPTIRSFHCIKPGRPVPTHRYSDVVA